MLSQELPLVGLGEQSSQLDLIRSEIGALGADRGYDGGYKVGVDKVQEVGALKQVSIILFKSFRFNVWGGGQSAPGGEGGSTWALKCGAESGRGDEPLAVRVRVRGLGVRMGGKGD